MAADTVDTVLIPRTHEVGGFAVRRAWQCPG